MPAEPRYPLRFQQSPIYHCEPHPNLFASGGKINPDFFGVDGSQAAATLDMDTPFEGYMSACEIAFIRAALSQHQGYSSETAHAPCISSKSLWEKMSVSRHAGAAMSTLALNSTITCPSCGHRKDETMPADACVWFYECEHCKTVLRPKPGDCCLYAVRNHQVPSDAAVRLMLRVAMTAPHTRPRCVRNTGISNAG